MYPVTTVPVQGKQRTDFLSDEEMDYQGKLAEWREKLHEEEYRARLWLDRETVSLVGAYFILMMLSKSWAELEAGVLIEDDQFLDRLRRIFGNRKVQSVLDSVVKRDGAGQPRYLECDRLSVLCLGVIQRRMRLEVSSSRFMFRLRSFCRR